MARKRITMKVVVIEIGDNIFSIIPKANAQVSILGELAKPKRQSKFRRKVIRKLGEQGLKQIAKKHPEALVAYDKSEDTIYSETNLWKIFPNGYAKINLEEKNIIVRYANKTVDVNREIERMKEEGKYPVFLELAKIAFFKQLEKKKKEENKEGRRLCT